MLWLPQERKTRRGTVFSAYSLPAAAHVLQSKSFDVAPLLRLSTAREAGLLDDIEEHTADSDDESDTPDDLPLPPPAKRPRTEADVLVAQRPPPRRHIRRREKRDAVIQRDGHTARPATVRARVVKDESIIRSKLDSARLPVALGAYSAKPDPKIRGAKKRYALADLLAMGFQLVKWDGITAKPIVDRHERVIVVLAGRPLDPGYAAAVERAYAAMSEQRKGAEFPHSMSQHRRGRFPAINCGLTYTKGQRVPCWSNGGEHAAIVQRLLANTDVRRIAAFGSAAFGLWAPNVYAYYKKHMDQLRERMPHLRRNFDKSVFACAAFNFGPDVWTFKHRDVLNTPFAMCSVTAMGPFDPSKGGHMILWDLRLVIEFPPASTILLPSATICHSNVPVQPGDARASFTQYTGGGLLRFVDNGFRTESQLAKEDPVEYERLQVLKEDRWAMGLSLLSTVDDLLEPVQ